MNRFIFCLKQKVLTLMVLWLILLFPARWAYADWRNVNPPKVSLDWGLSDVHFTSSVEGWAVGKDFLDSGGVLLHFTNGTWTSVTPPDVSPDWELSSVHFISPGEGWAVGHDLTNNGGVLLHFLNNSWTSVGPPDVGSDLDLLGVHFTSSGDGWVVGQNLSNGKGVILHFSNGSWAIVTPPNVSSDWGLWGVHFTSSSEGWAVGYDILNHSGILLHFSDDSWKSINPPSVSSDWRLHTVHLTSPNEGWAVGQDYSNRSGVLLHFSKGSWTSVSPPDVSADWGLNSIHSTSSSQGLAVGQDFSNKRGVLLQYSNGSWTSVDPPDVSTDWELFGVSLTSSNEAWAVGQGFQNSTSKGVLLKYAIPHISVSPTTISFPDLNIGTYLEKQVTVRDSGNAKLSIDTITSPSLPFLITRDDCSDRALGPGQSCKVIYRFVPTSSGTFESSSDIPSNDAQKDPVTVTMSGTGVPGPPISINLLNPPDGQGFDACSYYAGAAVPPRFQWHPSEIFKRIEVQFIPPEGSSKTPVKVSVKPDIEQLLITPSTWKKVLLLPDAESGTVYWKVVGGLADKSMVDSEVFSIDVKSPEPAGSPEISSTSITQPPPTLSWANNCNTKFKVWFGNDADFSKKKILSFSVKNPNDGGGLFSATLTPGQWKAVTKVVNNEVGATVYWYVESWDVLKRSEKIEGTPFPLTN